MVPHHMRVVPDHCQCMWISLHPVWGIPPSALRPRAYMQTEGPKKNLASSTLRSYLPEDVRNENEWDFSCICISQFHSWQPVIMSHFSHAPACHQKRHHRPFDVASCFQAILMAMALGLVGIALSNIVLGETRPRVSSPASLQHGK